MTADSALSHLDPTVFAPFLERTRWFAGKARPFRVSDVRRIGELPGTGDWPGVVIHLVELTYDDVTPDAPNRTELYHLPLVFYTDPERRLDHAFIGWWEEPDRGWVHAYDALHDREAMACWLRSFDEAAAAPVDVGSLRFHRLPGHGLDLGSHSTLFAGEQSNSSVAFGEDSILKIFRKVTPGVNPDVEVHERLTQAGSGHIAALYGWVEHAAEDGAVLQLGVLQRFLRTATDGFDLALASVRNLFSEADLHAHEVGGDFAAESARLGLALREIHDALAEHFPTDEASDATTLASAMTSRLDAALSVVPGLSEHADKLRELYAAVGGLGTVRAQRVHGDLHLGQTLRTALGWKIVDFEGEPAKPLAERVLPDSRWRDVAGILRSFDYAPHVVERTHLDHDVEGADQRAFRAAEWTQRNQDHFLLAYAGGELTDDQQILLDAYVADKAVYECVYETRNRPAWTTIPLAALAKIGAS